MTDLKIKSIEERLAEFQSAMTADEVAELLGVHHDTIYLQARKGAIPSFRIGTNVRFDPKKLIDWYKKHSIG